MIQPIRLLAVALVCAAALTAADGVVQVKLGATVARSIDEVKAANGAYAPKQEVDATTGETEVFLPYGNDPKLYWALDGNLSDASAGHCAEFVSSGSDHVANLTYKVVFDKPIKTFRCRVGYAELVQAPSCVAGMEYSTDGTTWKTVKEHPKGTRAVKAPFVEPYATITGLDTTALFLRIYARDGANPTAVTGPEMYLKLRISGDMGWGDAATTFFTGQNTLWVTAK